MSAARLRAVVQGRVQGVGFRYFVCELARSLQLGGFVRNTGSGDVEVLAEGERGALEALLAQIHSGPRAARVDTVHSAWLPATGEFSSFRIAGSR